MFDIDKRYIVCSCVNILTRVPTKVMACLPAAIYIIVQTFFTRQIILLFYLNN